MNCYNKMFSIPVMNSMLFFFTFVNDNIIDPYDVKPSVDYHDLHYLLLKVL